MNFNWTIITYPENYCSIFNAMINKPDSKENISSFIVNGIIQRRINKSVVHYDGLKKRHHKHSTGFRFLFSKQQKVLRIYFWNSIYISFMKTRFTLQHYNHNNKWSQINSLLVQFNSQSVRIISIFISFSTVEKWSISIFNRSIIINSFSLVHLFILFIFSLLSI